MKFLKIDLNELTDEELEAYLVLKRAINRIGSYVGKNDDDEIPENEIPDELPEPPEFTDEN